MCKVSEAQAPASDTGLPLFYVGIVVDVCQAQEISIQLTDSLLFLQNTLLERTFVMTIKVVLDRCVGSDKLLSLSETLFLKSDLKGALLMK